MPEDRAKVIARRAVWYAERKARLDAIKLASSCVDCGYDAHPAALQFDHRDRTTKALGHFSRNLSRRWEVILAEVAKCDVRCANCHAVRTAEWAAAEVTGQPHAARVASAT